MDNKSNKPSSGIMSKIRFATKDPRFKTLTVEEQQQAVKDALKLITSDMDKKTILSVVNGYFVQNNMNFECYFSKEKSNP